MSKAKKAAQVFKEITIGKTNDGGKSTINEALNDLYNRDGVYVQVESVNQTGDVANAIQLDSDQIAEMADLVAQSTKNVVADIGSSAIDYLMEAVEENSNTLNPFTTIIVPVIPTGKAPQEALDMMTELVEAGINPKKFKVVFNQVSLKQSKRMTRTFADLISGCKKLGIAINENAYIRHTDIFGIMKSRNITLSEIKTDNTDYDALLETESSAAKRAEYRDLQNAQGMIKGVVKMFDNVNDYIKG